MIIPHNLPMDLWSVAAPMLWQSSLLILTVLFVTGLLSKRSPHLRHALLLLALGKLLMPSIEVKLPAPIKTGTSAAVAHERAMPAPMAALIATEPATTPSATPLARTENLEINWGKILFGIYATGVLAGLVVLGSRFRRLQRVRRRAETIRDPEAQRLLAEVLAALGVRRQVALLRSAEVSGPLVAGIFRSVILLPAGVAFSLRELRLILLHEAAHLRRNDLAVDFIQHLAQVLWWFNPLVWALNLRLRAVSEECCDEIVLARRAASADDYCQTLVAAARKITAGRRSLLGVGMADHPLGRRIRRLMNPATAVCGGLTGVQTVCVILAGCLLVPNLRALEAEDAGGAHPSFDILKSATPWSELAPKSVVMNRAQLDHSDWRERDLRNASFCASSLLQARFSGANLRRANFAGADLQGADFSGADLTEANLTGVDLRGAKLKGATLPHAWMSGARIEAANFEGANLDWAFLRGAQVSIDTVIAAKWRTVIALLKEEAVGADLHGLDLSRANLEKLVLRNGNLSEANLTGTDLSFSDLRGTFLTQANLNNALLQGANLTKVSLRGAQLNRANLSHARLNSADLTEAVLIGSNLDSANLRDARLEGSNFAGADLRRAVLRGSVRNDRTTLDAKWVLGEELRDRGAAGRDLSGMDLSRLDLGGVSFQGARLAGANLAGTILKGADLSGADLSGANLNDARLGAIIDGATRIAAKWTLVNTLASQGAVKRDLTGVDLSHANLTGIRFEGAILRNANLEQSNLDGTNLRSAILEGSRMEEARFHNTVMPDGSIRSDDC